MAIIFVQSQNTFLELSKEAFEFVECDTDLEVRARDFDIKVEFFKSKKEQFIIFHNGEPEHIELGYEFSDKSIYEVKPISRPKYKVSKSEFFMSQVKKLLKETEPDYAVYDYNLSPDLDKESINLKNVQHRIFAR